MFEFIADDGLKESLENDSAELKRCAEAGAWKAVHVLAGSIVEAVLVDQVSAVEESKRPRDLGDPLEATLGKLIMAGEQLGVLSETTAYLVKALKNYRNLIHAGRALRLGDVVTPNSAQVAQALVGMVIADVGKASEKRGLTADQLLLKLRNDQSVSLVLSRLIRDMSTVEVEKLLLTRIPVAYLAEGTGWPEDAEDFGVLRRCFHKAFDGAPAHVKRRVCGNYIRMIKEDTGPRIADYERAFFRGAHLKFIPDEGDRELVKERLLGLIKSHPEHAKATLEGVGKWLTEKEVEAVARDALSLLLFRPKDGSAARSLLKELYTDERKHLVTGVIQEHIAHYEENKQPAKVRVLQERIDVLEGRDYDFDDIPF